MAGLTEPLFTSADLDEMRQLSESSLPDFALIERPGNTPGPGGTIRRDAYTQVAVDVPCRVSVLAVSEQERVGSMMPNASWTIVFPVGTDVQLGDRVTIAGARRAGVINFDESTTQHALHVVGPLSPHTYETLCRVFASDLPPTEQA
jgi:hypothetical protein